MMKLLYTPIAGYVHTVEAVIHYGELENLIEPVPIKPFDADTPLSKVNPLGKVPTRSWRAVNISRGVR
jgi:glutathione S-transferase